MTEKDDNQELQQFKQDLLDEAKDMLDLASRLEGLKPTIDKFDEESKWLLGASAVGLSILFSKFTEFIIKKGNHDYIPNTVWLIPSIILLVLATTSFGLIKSGMFWIQTNDMTNELKEYSALTESELKGSFDIKFVKDKIKKIKDLTKKLDTYISILSLAGYLSLAGKVLLVLGLFSFVIYVIMFILEYNTV